MYVAGATDLSGPLGLPWVLLVFSVHASLHLIQGLLQVSADPLRLFALDSPVCFHKIILKSWQYRKGTRGSFFFLSPSRRLTSNQMVL